MAITSSETHSTTTKVPPTFFVKCVSCGFTEECTPAYVLRVRERYQGRWICGLCVEAVKDEVLRSDMLISTEEALDRHITFCKHFRSSCSLKEAEHPIFAMGRLLRRSLNTVDGVRSSGLVRSKSCVSALSR